MRTFVKDSKKVLEFTENSWKTTETIKKNLKIESSLLGLLSHLNSLGFLENEVMDEMSPITSSKWRTTKEGTSFLRLIKKKRLDFRKSEKDEEKAVVMSIPMEFKNEFLKDHKEVRLTQEVLKTLVIEAQKEIKIMSPFIDATITSLLSDLKKDVNVKIITTAKTDEKDKIIKNYILTRLEKQNENIEVKYIKKSEEGTQLYQIHAKMIISDDKLCYVGSANIIETSIFHNLELGLLISDPYLIDLLSDIFDNFFSLEIGK